jgi:hypothetical protein
MKRRSARSVLLLIGLLATVPSSAAKKPPQPNPATIPPGSTLFIDCNNGFDTFILAALQNKQVQLKLVSSAEKADYVMDSSLFHTAEVVATPKYATTGRTSEAAFKITSKSGDIVWAYAVTKGILSRGKQSVAEACAKHLKEIVK